MEIIRFIVRGFSTYAQVQYVRDQREMVNTQILIGLQYWCYVDFQVVIMVQGMFELCYRERVI